MISNIKVVYISTVFVICLANLLIGQAPGPFPSSFQVGKPRLLDESLIRPPIKHERIKYVSFRNTDFPEEEANYTYKTYIDRLNQNEAFIDQEFDLASKKFGSASSVIKEMAAKTGLFYYDLKQYKDASSYFSKADDAAMPYIFEQAYSALSLYEYQEAIYYFQQIKEHPLLPDIPFYIAYCQYRSGDYSAAISNLENIGPASQFYMAKEMCIAINYYAIPDKVKAVHYAEKSLSNVSESSYANDLLWIVGTYYYEQLQFQKAKIYLEKYQASSRHIEYDVQYALAMSYQKSGAFAAAIPMWRKLSNLTDSIGHYALLHLGECLYALEDYRQAGLAFHKASNKQSVKEVRLESAFLYGKTLAVSKNDAEALKYLSAISNTDIHFSEAQNLIKDILYRTDHVDAALRIIDSLKYKNTDMNEVRNSLLYSKALQYFNSEEKALAVPILEKVHQNTYNASLRAKSLFRLAEASYENGNYDKALIYLNSISINQLDKELEPYLYYTKAYCFLQNNKIQEAISAFSNCLQHTKSKHKILTEDIEMRLADCYVKTRQFDKAQQQYKLILNKNNGSHEYALYQYASILMGTNKNQSAANEFEDYIKRYPKGIYTTDVKYRLGLVYDATEQIQKAIDIWKIFLQETPKNHPRYNLVLMQMGLYYYQEKQYALALEYYVNALHNEPELSDQQTALAAIKEIYTINLSDPQAYIDFVDTLGKPVNQNTKDSILFESGEYHFENKQYEKAIEFLTSYLLNNHDGIHVHKAMYYRAESYFNLKNYNAALLDYKLIIAHFTGQIKQNILKKSIAISFEQNKNYGECIQYVNELLPLLNDKKDVSQYAMAGLKSAFYMNRGDEVYQFDNKFEQAYMTRADSINLAYMVGKIAYQKGDYDKAVDYLNEVTKLTNSAKSLEAKYLIANIYFNKGEYVLSERMTDRLIQDAYDHKDWLAKGLLLISDIYIKQGDWFSAKASLDALIENYSGDPALVEEAKRKLKIADDLEINSNK